MNMIDLGDAVAITVKYQGQEYSLREPTTAELKKLHEDERGDSDPRAIFEFLETLGMPLDVVEKLGVSRIKALLEGVVGVISPKK